MRTHLLALLAATTLTACHGASTQSAPETQKPGAAGERRTVGTDPGHVGRGTPLAPREGNALAAFAAGCFWGVEDNFRQVPGVVATAVGYTGGHTDDPTYETVCTHTTGHAETVLIEFDPKAVSYQTLLDVFFANHDPTTKDQQGPDIGDQYRSAIFTFSVAQESAARSTTAREEAARKQKVWTEIRAMGAFWKAEEYHQQYDEKTGTHSCPIPKGLPGGS
jgi:peptide-methionine (S)-S-oxide reductase